MFCWHKWGKWSSPHNGIFSPSSGSIGYFSVCQLRVCDKCGKAQYRRLPQMRSLEELRKGVHFVMSRQGYSPFAVLMVELAATQDTYAPYTDLMKEVKAGFGRTMSHLPAVFGVSRQTLYNWLNGETPKEHHQGKLVQLAAAARVFTEAGFKPTALSLDRTVAQGKSFVELIGQGADGKEIAEKLLRIEKRGVAARQKLDSMLGDRTRPRPSRCDEAKNEVIDQLEARIKEVTE